MLLKQNLPKVLICDDDQNIHLALKAALGSEFDLKSAHNGDEACIIAKKNQFDLVLMDMEMRTNREGLETIPRLLEIQPDLEIIFFSGQTEFGYVRAAMQAGAVDYIPKDSGPDELRHIFKKTLELRRLKEKTKQSSSEVKRVYRNNLLIGTSPAIDKLRKVIERARQSPAPVIIHGETGTGKEVVARLLRKQLSDGSLEPFVCVDASTIQSSIAESVLFGYEKGAFTGAEKSTPGLFEEANGGTIYFDELANMPLEIQNKMLRIFQEKQVMRLGSAKTIDLEFRVIAATNQDLEQMVKEGRFKEDLYQRLAVLQINLPPLRERKEDIPLFLEFFNETMQTGQWKLNLLPETIQILQEYPFPGNIRELSNLVLYLYTMSESPDVSPLDLPPKFLKGITTTQKSRFTRDNRSLTDESETSSDHRINFYSEVEGFERKLLADSYTRFQGNVTKMAVELGMDRSYLHNKLKLLGVHPTKRPPH